MPKEYIEREAAIKAVCKYCNCYIDEEICSCADKTAIMEIPAANVVEVVRCKDCKHFHYLGKTSLLVDGKHVPAGWCCRGTKYDEEFRMTATDFCSYGERKEDINAID